MKIGKGMGRVSFVAVVAALFAATLDAKTLYVGPTGGTVSSDDYDGLEEVWQGAGTTNGPMKTLAAVMKKASEGDTVIALPGYYNEGVSNPEARDSTTNLMRRVIITKNVTLKSKEGPEKTFIVGEASPAPNATETGCGMNAVACVYNSGTLQGFTLTGGRTLGESVREAPYAGGGVYGGTVVDCIISNNAAGYGGGGARNATVYRSRFYNNKAPSKKGSAIMGQYNCYSCYFDDGDIYMCYPRNCTLRACVPYASSLYNCILLTAKASTGNPNDYYRCVHVYEQLEPAVNNYFDNCVQINADDIAIDRCGVVTNGMELIRDKGNNDYLSDWLSTVDFMDIAGTPRVMNGTADVGAYEFDPREYISDVLSPDGAVTVTNISATVVCLDRSVSVGPGGDLMGVLNLSESASPTDWSFFASVEGTGALKVFFGDAAEPSRTVVFADGQVEVTHSGTSPTGIRLVYDGEDGAAEVSRFSRDTVLAIVADEAGITLTGAYVAPGRYIVPAGETKTVTVARSPTATRFVSGLDVNGVFYDFNSYLDGMSFSVTGSVRASSLHIKVVYAATHEWFVDPVNGSDSNSGLYTNLAFKTLAKAASIATNSGDRILAAPGVYNEGGMLHDTHGSNRVIVAGGVLLEGYGGAAVTTIEGLISDLPGNYGGCASNSMRAVLMGKGAVVRGFTITKGRPVSPTLNKNYGRGGGVCGGLAVDCVFSNNVSMGPKDNSLGGNAASGSATLLRCYIGDDPDGSFSVYSGVKLVDCVHDTPKYGNSTISVFNSTFLRGYVAVSNGGPTYNSIFYSYSPRDKVYSCICVNGKYSDSEAYLGDDGSKFNVPLSDIAYDGETYRPLSTSLAVDAGRSSYYDIATNGWSALWMQFVGKDYAGGQRVYNGGRVDVGAGEYDWRGDFAKDLAKKGVSVAEAGGGVTTNAVAGIDVPAGDVLKLGLELKASGTVTFAIAADDLTAVQVLVDQVQVEVGEGGVVAFEAGVGESVVEISCSEGTATVSSIVLPRQGVLLILR